MGWYLSLRLNGALYENAKYDFKESDFILAEIPDNAREGIGTISIGTSFTIAYPIWLYLGGGISYRERSYENEDGTKYFSLENERNIRYFPEAGIMIRLKGLIISGGASYSEGNIIYQMGLGLNF